jgi:AmmeMemoRadiSam system protein B
MAADDRPRLVPLEPRRVSRPDGGVAVELSDPLGVLGELAPVTAAAWYVLAHLDGTRTAAEVAAGISAQGMALPTARVAQLVAQARAAGLVEGPVYEGLRRRALEEYRSAPRAPACAGASYPDDPGELRALLDGLLGALPGPQPAHPGVRLLVSPHVDYARGGPCYARAWQAMRACDADLFVVFGTAHLSPARPFTLTRQDYDTPLGPVPTDRGLADALLAALPGEDLLADELCHRGEHSVEFQLVWLRHLFPRRPIQALPVLCSGISHLAEPEAATGGFLDALGAAVRGRRVCWVAGADLSHLGPMYGDAAPPGPEALAGFAAEDRRTLGFLEAGDAAGFHRDASRDDARRRICGVAPIYAAMRSAGRGARLLDYAQWSDGTDSVSFAAAAG